MDLFKALELYAKPFKSEYSCGETFESLDWFEINEQPKPTLYELTKLYDAYLVKKEKNKYLELRAAAYPSLQDQLDIMYNKGFDGWFKHLRAIKMTYPSPYKDKEPEPGNVMEELEKRMSTIETNNAADLARTRQEMADLQTAIIDTKGAISAIKGFMMEIPNIQKQLSIISAQLENKDNI